MPYIKQHQKARLNAGAAAQNAGELTYQFQQTILRHIGEGELKYETLARVLGALEGAKLDFIERVVKPYEAKKQEENGDVWAKSKCDARAPMNRIIRTETPGHDFWSDWLSAFND
jgi:hypothetical protein